MDEESVQGQPSKNNVVGFILTEYTPQRFISAAIYDDRRRTF